MSSPGGETVTAVLEQVLHYHLVQAKCGLLPPGIQADTYRQVLHLNCRSGTWALDLALSYPGVEVTGLDASPHLIEIARQHASIINIGRVHFATQCLDQPLPFADHSFDLIHFSLFLPVFRPQAWPTALGEYWRVLRPGGTMNFACLTLGPSSSNAQQRIMQLLERFFRAQGYAFSEHGGSLFHGVYLYPLLRAVGFEQIRYTLHPVNFGGWNNEAGRACYQLFVSEVQKHRQIFLDHHLINGDEFDAIILQKMQDLQDLTFFASGTLFSIVAVKPKSV